MPNTSEIYRQNAILEYQNQLKAKLAKQHVQREGEVPMYALLLLDSYLEMETQSLSIWEILWYRILWSLAISSKSCMSRKDVY